MGPQIAVLCPTQGPGSGAERVLILLLESMAPSMIGRLLLLSPRGSATHEAASAMGYPVLPWHAANDSFAQNLRAYRRSRQELPPGVRMIHAWTARAFEWAALLARGRGATAMGTLHDHPRAPFHRPWRRLLMAHCAYRLRPLVCVSDALRAACAQAYRGPPAIVIRNGLPPAPPASPREGGSLRVGFAGVHATWKGFATVAAWVSQNPPVPLEWHFFGDPATEVAGPLRTLREAKGSSVVIHGRVPADTIFDQIDVLAHPSIFFDPLPTALIEASRAGVPAVASDTGGTGEIVADGITGFLFPPEEPSRGLAHILRLGSDADLRMRMASAARSRFEAEFRISQMTDSYLALWNLSLQNSGDGDPRNRAGRLSAPPP